MKCDYIIQITATRSQTKQYSNIADTAVTNMVTCPLKINPSIELVLGLQKTGALARKRYSPEQIIMKLREAEVLLSQGQTVGQVCRPLEISVQIYYR